MNWMMKPLRMTERLVALRISTKHINLWVRQLEMKRNEMSELAGLIGLDEIKREIEKRSLSKHGPRDAPTLSQRM